MKKHVMNKDKWVGIICLVISLFFGYNSTRINGPLNPGDPGASLFPLIGCAILLICGIALLIRKTEGNDKVFLTKQQAKRALILFAVYILVFVSLWLLGFIFTTFASLLVLCIMFTSGRHAEQKKWVIVVKSLVYAILVAAAIYIIYDIALNMQLPEGLLWDALS